MKKQSSKRALMCQNWVIHIVGVGKYSWENVAWWKFGKNRHPMSHITTYAIRCYLWLKRYINIGESYSGYEHYLLVSIFTICTSYHMSNILLDAQTAPRRSRYNVNNLTVQSNSTIQTLQQSGNTVRAFFHRNMSLSTYDHLFNQQKQTQRATASTLSWTILQNISETHINFGHCILCESQ